MSTISELEGLLAKVDVSQKKSLKRLIVLSLVPALIMVGLLYYVVTRIKMRERELSDKRQQIMVLTESKVALEKSRDSLNREVENARRIYDNTKMQLEKDFGWSPKDAGTSDAAMLAESKAAHDEIMKMIQSGKVNYDLIIRYYMKDKEGDKVRKTLLKINYREIALMLDSATYHSKIPSNAIAYDPSSAKVDDIKLIAFCMIRAGIQLQNIRPYNKRYLDGKINSVEIFTDADAAGFRMLKVADIVAATRFPLNKP
jgi:hypothetical protein